MVLHLNAGKDTTVYIKKIKNGQSFKLDRFCLRDCCRTCFCCWCRVRRSDKWSYLAKRKNFVHKSDLAPIAFSFGTRSQKQQKTFLKNLHFLEGLFPFPVNIYYRTKKSVENYICGVSPWHHSSDFCKSCAFKFICRMGRHPATPPPLFSGKKRREKPS